VITVSRTAAIRQTSQAGKNEPTILKEGARVQLLTNSTPGARLCLAREVQRSIDLNGLRAALKIVINPFAIGSALDHGVQR
jgi:hypothetical protein